MSHRDTMNALFGPSRRSKETVVTDYATDKVVLHCDVMRQRERVREEEELREAQDEVWDKVSLMKELATD